MQKFIMKLYQFILISIFYFISLPAHACLDMPCDLKQITNQIKQQPPLNKFEQIKTIAVLSKPLKSNGYLLVTTQKSIVWQTKSPIKSTTVITPSSLKQFNKNDQLISLPENTNNQTSQLISSTFLAILSGDLSALSENFDVESSCHNNQWNINLTSKDPSIARLIKHINIQGQQHIQRLSFTEFNEDTTRLFFTPEGDTNLQEQLGKYLVD